MEGKKYSFLVLLFVVNLLTCRKEGIIPYSKGNHFKSFSELFDDFWSQMNNNYVYWDIDTTNWDEVYKKYHPLFAKLNLQNKTDVNTSLIYFGQMTNGLIDSHYYISFTNSDLLGQYIYPALNRKKEQLSFHSPYDYLAADTGYLDIGFKNGFYVTNDRQKLQVICGLIKGSILYFKCNIFSLNEAYASSSINSAKTAIQYFFSEISSGEPVIKGIIIDLRNNPGGEVEDLSFLMGEIINRPLKFGFTRYKTGLGKFDYTPWIPEVLTPSALGKTINLPVVALIDNYTVSLAEAVAMSIHCLPNGKLVGERTWGATGPETNLGIYNDGSFNIPGFLSVYTSSAAFKYIDGKAYEGKGFPPDFPVKINPDTLNRGDDEMLDKAIALIR